MSLVRATDLVLVAYIPSPRDLEIARLLGWYRIPLRTAPKVIAVDWLAFYQPASFGEQRWRIQWLAPVRGHELVPRAELLQEERHHPKAGEEYYKIQLGPLEKLPTPIRAEKWKRITFFYTTGEYLHRAATVRDLIIQPGERKLLWRALRERATREQSYEVPQVDLPPDVIAAFLGIKEMAGDYN